MRQSTLEGVQMFLSDLSPDPRKKRTGMSVTQNSRLDALPAVLYAVDSSLASEGTNPSGSSSSPK